ncbi:hypothetical protein OIDMADRAFT_36537 [Oidiodendron maius Zn]|uniref:Uncharacterized protein n=1 Tax=Oidiodendron maius (strain Zn) TaxID=913774 RepID=A0A0C3GPN4_OIDMZ|nr:hypothetical protein OIDMADRAFT_36537 [Oidiodendron maius Zn]
MTIQRPTAPLDYLQFFQSILDQRQAGALIFTDATGSDSLFIACSKEAALHYIQQDSKQTRAHLLDLDSGISDADIPLPADAIPKPACLPGTTLCLPSHQPSQPDSTIPASDTSIVPSGHVNDLHEESTPPAKKRKLANYVPPVALSPGDGDASPHLPRARGPSEVTSRLALTNQHLPEVTWLMAQKVPPSTITIAYDMITKAKEIGDDTVIQSWKAICMQWRAYSTLTTINLYTPKPSSSQALAMPPHLQDAPCPVQAFCTAFQAVNQSIVNGTLQLMFHRHYLADLFQHYKLAETAVRADPREDERQRGVTDAALVKMRLFLSLHPEHTDLANPRINPKSRKAWEDFHAKIEKGRRWQHLRDKTNPGILALIPESVSNRWIEKELSHAMFCSWVDLIIRYNQSAITLGKAMLPGLQHALSSQSIPEKKIRLEITDIEDLNGYSDKSVLFEEVE